MALLTLEEAIADLRAEGAGEDGRIEKLLTEAIQSAADYIDRPIPWTDTAGNPVELPESVNAAIRLELRALYDNPADVHSLGFKRLLDPYRSY